MWDDKLLRSGNRLLLWLYDEFRNIKKNECTRLSLFKTFNPATITTDSKPERLQKISQNRIFSFGLPVFKIHVKIFSLPFSSMLWCILADALLHILTELTFNVFTFIYAIQTNTAFVYRYSGTESGQQRVSFNIASSQSVITISVIQL